MAKRNKKKNFFREIKELTPDKIRQISLVNPEKKLTFLEQLIPQFRGGEKDFFLAFEQFLDVYQATKKACEDLRHQTRQQQQKHNKRENFYPLISQFKTHFETFFEDYSPQEKGTLVEAFMLRERTEVLDLYRLSYYSEQPLTLTSSQMQSCLLYWTHYQIFQEHIIHPNEVNSPLWKKIDSFFFG